MEYQRRLGKGKGIVMDGRDIGTVVFPGAAIKIFLTASLEVRAERRYKELIEKGMAAEFSEVKSNLEKRDYIDSNRNDSPLKMADDAILLDNSHMTLEQQLTWFRELYKQVQTKTDEKD